MRWLFLLLLLVNALYLGWQLRKPEVNDTFVMPANVSRIRLLTEEDASLLLPRQSGVTPPESESLQQEVESAAESATISEPSSADETATRWCQVISGIEQASVATELQGRLAQQGLESTVVPVEVERVLAYELTLEKPVALQGQQALLENLAALGLSAEESRVKMKPVYIIGRYGSRAELNRARNELIGLFQPDEYQVVSQDRLYDVWVETDSSVETGNKIKEVDQFFNSAIKIEKKLCKGVASTGVRD